MDEKEMVRLSIQAQIDQAAAGLEQLAIVSYGYYLSLCKAGFNEAQALMLVVEFQKAALNNGRESK